MQATLLVECACGEVVGRVGMDTADLNIPEVWASRGRGVMELLRAHRQGFCAVYNPTMEIPRVVHFRMTRWQQACPDCLQMVWGVCVQVPGHDAAYVAGYREEWEFNCPCGHTWMAFR